MNQLSGTGKRLCCGIAMLFLSACSGSQSTLSGLGPESDRVLTLTWVLFVGAAVVLLVVIGCCALALYGSDSVKRLFSDKTMVLGLGLVFPVLTLTALLVYGFLLMGQRHNILPVDENPLRIAVTGYQWWWRVEYLLDDGSRIESANEIRIPVNRTIEVELTTADVLHSFWVPAYAGKVDMIPGRVNYLRFSANEAGVVRGQCAEYCGGAHALMAFHVIALRPAEFSEWLQRERGNASEGNLSEVASQGKTDFLQAGCHGCHRIRGTAAKGEIGPDLTHIASRQSLGAATLPNSTADLQRWIAHHQKIKPDNLMPTFDFLTEKQVSNIALYLSELE